MKRPRPNLDLVAEKTGFGRATVARALSPDNKYPMAEGTREKIRQAAAKLGYGGDWKGRVLATGRSRQIGLVFSGDTPVLTGILGHVLEVLPQELTRAGYQVLLIPVPHGPPVDLEERYRGQLDGFLVIPPSAPSMVPPKNLPTVLVNLTMSNHLPAVLADDGGGMALALDHLATLGHRRIAFLPAPEGNDHYSASLRRDSYLAGMARRGFKPFLIPGQITDTLERIKAFPGRSPTSIICYEHLSAMEVLHRAWRLKIQVPRDLGILTFNNDRILERTQPPLTCIHVPITGMARSASDILLRLLRGEDAAPPPPLAETLVLRESTAKAR